MSTPPPEVEQLPVPPPGPGVAIPFAVPPTDRDRRRTAITWGAIVVVVVLACGGAAAGLVTLVVTSQNALKTQARAVVTSYLTDLRAGAAAKAYDLLCDRRRTSLPEFTQRERALPPIRSFTVHPARVSGRDYQVPVNVTTADGRTVTEKYVVINEGQSGSLRVCEGPR